MVSFRCVIGILLFDSARRALTRRRAGRQLDEDFLASVGGDAHNTSDRHVAEAGQSDVNSWACWIWGCIAARSTMAKPKPLK